jgi:L-alanine-DL-glutamate epimerase-like enolase superfamily enzyme
MPITRVSAWTRALPLREPTNHHGQFFGDVPVAFVRIQTDQGLTGMGCLLPPVDIDDEALTELATSLEAAGEHLVGRHELHRLDLLALVPEPLRLAVDTALLDLLGQHANLPVHLLRGASAAGVTCSRRVPPMGTRATLEHATTLVDQGARSLYIEAFGDQETDAQRLLQLRDRLGDEVSLALHASGNHADLHALCADTAPVGLTYIVVDPTTPQRLSRLAHGLPTPLAVRCANAREARGLVSAGVKVLYVGMRTAGGFAALDEIAAVARGHGARLVVSTGPEPALTVAAALHFTLGERCVGFCELDGHLGLRQDPTEGCVEWREGELYPTRRPGLGWARPRED